MFPNIGMGELVVILIVVLLLFGAKRLPEVARAIGRSVKSLKEGMNESTQDSKIEDKKRGGS